MKLNDMSMKSLLDLHNTLADVQAGPKSFATKAKLIARIEHIAADKRIELTSFEQTNIASTADQLAQPQANDTAATEDSSEATMAQVGKGIGRLARKLLLDPAGYPHAAIAKMVNARIEGAQATSKSVRWYACRMRKEGVEVPERQRPVVEQGELPQAKSNPETLAAIGYV